MKWDGRQKKIEKGWPDTTEGRGTVMAATQEGATFFILVLRGG